MNRLKFGILLFCSSYLAYGQDLLSIYELALQHDTATREAHATMLAAEEYKPQAIARMLPQISATAEMDRNSVLSRLPPQAPNANPSVQKIQQGGRNIGFWNSYGSITLRQAVYHHDHWVALSQAENQLAQAQANYEGSIQLLGRRVAVAYFDLLYAQDSLGFAESEKQATERQLEQAKARFDVGLIAITDVNVAQAGFDQAVAGVIKAENDVDNAREALREIIGDFSGDLKRLDENIPLKAPEPHDMAEWDKRAQAGNLGIIAAENETEVARKNIQLRFAGHLPTVDIIGSAGFTDNNRPYGVSTESQVIGAQISVPLFQGGYVSSQVTQARHQLEAAQERLEKQRRATAKDVKNAYRGINAAIAKVEALKAAVVSSQSAVEATEAGFEVGTRTMVEVLTEQKNLYGAKRDHAKSRYDYIINSLNLKQAAGLLERQDLELVNGWLAATAPPPEAGKPGKNQKLKE